jgi:uncharacterized protein YwgA
MKQRDWLLLVVAAAEDDGLDPVQLQKSLFLLGEKRRRYLGPKFYEFEPHNYGPFSKDVYTHATELVADGCLTKEQQPGYSWSVFRATDAGRRVAERLRREAPEEAATYLEQAVEWVKSQSFYDLVRSIYKHFPEYRANSIFRE